MPNHSKMHLMFDFICGLFFGIGISMYVQFQKCYDTAERSGRFLLLDCSRPDSHKALYVVGQEPPGETFDLF